MSGIPEVRMLEGARNVNPIILTEKEKSDVHYGYCQCGCGELAPLSQITNKRFGYKKGNPVRFISGHNSKINPPIGNKNPMWNGGISHLRDGRILILNRTHKRSSYGYVLKSIIMAEKALGKPLPRHAQVHHFNGDTSQDDKNLIICENQAYHHLLHQRKRAYDACGHATWRKCRYCKEYDDPKNLYIPIKNNNLACHKKCKNKSERERYSRKQAEEL